MNGDMISGSWTELKGKIKTKWAKLTDSDVDGLQGNLEQLSGKLQKVYGYAKDKAEQEFADFKASLKSNSNKPVSDLKN